MQLRKRRRERQSFGMIDLLKIPKFALLPFLPKLTQLHLLCVNHTFQDFFTSCVVPLLDWKFNAQLRYNKQYITRLKISYGDEWQRAGWLSGNIDCPQLSYLWISSAFGQITFDENFNKLNELYLTGGITIVIKIFIAQLPRSLKKFRIHGRIICKVETERDWPRLEHFTEEWYDNRCWRLDFLITCFPTSLITLQLMILTSTVQLPPNLKTLFVEHATMYALDFDLLPRSLVSCEIFVSSALISGKHEQLKTLKIHSFYPFPKSHSYIYPDCVEHLELPFNQQILHPTTCHWPKSLTHLKLYNVPSFDSIELIQWPSTVKHLELSNFTGKITSADWLPPHLEYLELPVNYLNGKLTELVLPLSLRKLFAGHREICLVENNEHKRVQCF